MTESEYSEFTYINYAVCNYCEHLVRAEHRDGYNLGCELVQNEQGQYARLYPMNLVDAGKFGITVINPYQGCQNFEASGLPAHPDVKPALVQNNPLAASIPEDADATETSFDFEDKINQHPHVEVPLLTTTPDGKTIHSIQ